MSTTVQDVPTETYGLDPVHSTIGFGVRYNGPTTFRSTFDQFDAQLSDAVLTGTAQVASIRIDEPNLKGHLLSEEFFGAEQTPTVTFRSTTIRPAVDGSVEVDGELTIKGVTKPVTATGSFATGSDAFGGERAFFVLSATVDRRDFGLNWQNQLPNGNDALAWNVTLDVDLQLVKQA
jgi:polyisoprenoid-binding protein YceI